MSMDDWKVIGYVDPAYGSSWVYKASPHFAKIHLSYSVSQPDRTHVATDDRENYYFGITKTFNRQNMPQAIQDQLKAAWRDYYTVATGNAAALSTDDPLVRLNSDDRRSLAAAFAGAKAWEVYERDSAVALDAGDSSEPWTATQTQFDDKNRDVQLSFDYNSDPENVDADSERKLRFVMQVVQQQATNALANAGQQFTTQSEVWIDFFARYPLLFNFRSRNSKKFSENDFSLSVNTKLVGAIIDAKAPADIKQAFIQALQDSSGKVLETTTKTTNLQYLTLIRNYSKASTLTIYRAQLDMQITEIKTLCGGTRKANIKVDYDQVDFEINNTLALAIYEPLQKVAVDEAVAFMTTFFKQFAKQEYTKFQQWLDSLGH